MATDVSRVRIDPFRDFAGVLLQQGRLLLDADFNELVGLVDRRLRAGFFDVATFDPEEGNGNAWVPRATPDAFLVTASGGALSIGRGRMYVDGLMAENHGSPPLKFDRHLSELAGTTDTPYEEQPYRSDDDVQLPTGGTHLVYLDVWQRDITHLQDPTLVEQAVGVDTTTRMQTAWQVRILEDVGDVSCDTPDEDFPGWTDLVRPSAGRLTTGTIDIDPGDDPCELPPTGGYRGLENQTYRVEIHDGGAPGTATFKWSRDNGSVAMLVEEVVTSRILRLSTLGKDDVLRVSTGNWVEILDDRYELAGRPGAIRKVTVDDEARTVTFDDPLPADLQGPDASARHLRIRRWDQAGAVRDEAGNTLVHLDQAGASGVIPVPAAGTRVVLEHGVVVSFSLDGAGLEHRAGDYWVFAARTADASIEMLAEAPPLGTHHHYARLGLVDFPDEVRDCRRKWPVVGTEETSCDCTVCVTAESHASGAWTIQAALDEVRDSGGTVCLGPGLYRLEAPLRVSEARSVRLHGQGWRTVVLQGGQGPVISIDRSLGVVVEDLALLAPEFRAHEDEEPRDAGTGLGMAVALMNNAGVTIQRCVIAQLGGRMSPLSREGVGLAGFAIGGGAAIAMTGFQVQTRIRENVIAAGVGVIGLSHNFDEGNLEVVRVVAPRRFLTTANLFIDDNVMLCPLRGVGFEGLSLHLAELRIARNVVMAGRAGGLVLTGAVPVTGPASSHVVIDANTVISQQDGIVVGTDDTRVEHNVVGAIAGGGGSDGIVLAGGLRQRMMQGCRVTGNRVVDVGGAGIAIRGWVGSAHISENAISGARRGGIVMDEGSRAEDLQIEENDIRDVAPTEGAEDKALAGIRIRNAARAAVVGNTIFGVATVLRDAVARAGIEVHSCQYIRIAGNEVERIGPEDSFEGEGTGIDVAAPFDRLDIVDNVVRRSRGGGAVDGSEWRAVFVRPLADLVPAFVIGVAGEGFLFGERSVVRVPRGREVVSVRGNMVDAFGGVPAMQMVARGACVITENRCFLDARQSPVVDVRGGAVVAGNNYLESSADDVAMTIDVASGAVTVLGNIATGPIEVDGSPLGPPWADLNVT